MWKGVARGAEWERWCISLPAPIKCRLFVLCLSAPSETTKGVRGHLCEEIWQFGVVTNSAHAVFTLPVSMDAGVGFVLVGARRQHKSSGSAQCDAQHCWSAISPTKRRNMGGICLVWRRLKASVKTRGFLAFVRLACDGRTLHRYYHVNPPLFFLNSHLKHFLHVPLYPDWYQWCKYLKMKDRPKIHKPLVIETPHCHKLQLWRLKSEGFLGRLLRPPSHNVQKVWDLFV